MLMFCTFLSIEDVERRGECVICYNDNVRVGWCRCSTVFGNELDRDIHTYKPTDTYTDTSTDRGICHSCLLTYFKTEITAARISSDGSIRCICSDSNCDARFSQTQIIASLQDSNELLEKYYTFWVNSQMLSDPETIWCPNPRCVSVATRLSRHRAYCGVCKFHFCAKCGGDHPRATSCSRAEEAGFREWKRATKQGCKRCPCCRLFIEKDGGCRQMICSFCGHQFCWRCKRNYDLCDGGSSCRALGLWKHRAWGDSTLERGTKKALCAPVALATAGIAAGVMCAAAGVLALSAPLAITYHHRNVQRIKKKYTSGQTLASVNERNPTLEENSIEDYDIYDSGDDIVSITRNPEVDNNRSQVTSM